MYRCVALLAHQTGCEPSDGPALCRLIESHEIDFDWDTRPPMVLLDGAPVEHLIRGDDVGDLVSVVAAVPDVRAAMVDAQRRIARAHPGLVSEGRDQGSVVFPDANVRFYLTADPEVRTQRRVRQLQRSGNAVDASTVSRGIQARDTLDSSRSVGPLVCPEGAIEIDTSELSLDEVVDRLESEVRNRINDRLPPC